MFLGLENSGTIVVTCSFNLHGENNSLQSMFYTDYGGRKTAIRQVQFPAVNHINFTSGFISLLFRNKNVLFCIENKIKKEESISSSMKKKIILRFTFTSFSIQNN